MPRGLDAKSVTEVILYNSCNEHESIVGWGCEITDECSTRGASNEIHICDSNMNGSYEREVISRRQPNNETENFSIVGTMQGFSLPRRGISAIYENKEIDHASLPLGIFASKSVSCRISKSDLHKKVAFTLAEVLITLGIIGVVAALTLPALIQGYKKQEASTRLKKFYSTMTQAIATAEADSGTKAYDWDALLWPTYDPANSYKLTSVYYNKYIAPYIKTLKVEDGVYDPKNNINSKMKIYFSDGSTAELNDGLCVDVYYDINGPKKPNQTGKDIFLFYIATAKSHANNRQHELYQNQSFSVGYLPLYNTETKALNACKTNASFCSTLLMYHNFEFPKNYPYKL